MKVCGRSVKALVDTGAQFTLLNRSFIRQNDDISYGASVGLSTPITDSFVQSIAGRVELELGNQCFSQDVCVMNISKCCYYDMILGYDVMLKLKAVIDLEYGCLRVNGNNYCRKEHKQGKNHGRIGTCESLRKESEYEPIDTTTQEKLTRMFRGDHMKLSTDQLERVEEILNRNRKILVEDVAQMTGASLPPYKPEFLDNKAIYQRQYRIPHKLYGPVRDKIEGLERAGIVSKTCSSWNTPAMFLEKKPPSTDIRMVLDLRKINQIVQPLKYPLMRIDEIIEKLGGSKVFSTLDLNNGYFNVKLHESVKERFAFATPFGRYKMERLPQGLSTSAGWFQKIMNEALFDVISDGHCMVFQDDVIIFTEDVEDHIRVLNLVLGALRRINMAVRPSKCALFRASLKFLGHIVDQNGFRPSQENIEVVKNFERPQTIKQIRSFLGTINFYRKFIPGITELAEPLYAFLKKGNAKINWNRGAEEAFQTLKNKLVEAPLLTYPDFGKDFIVKTDASGIGVGAVLEQLDGEGGHQPIAFCSRKLNAAERRYSAIEREALAIVYGLAQFRHITYGYKILLQTDHRPLSYIFQLKDTNMRLVRWLLQVQDNDLIIEYQPGKFNFVADWLSRAYSDDSPLVTVAASHMNDVMSIDRIVKCQREDLRCKGLIKSLMDKNIGKENEYVVDNDGILMKRVIPDRFHGWKYRVIVPESIQKSVISIYHDGVAGGHLSTVSTLWKIRRMFTWGGMVRDVEEYVRTCDICQKRSIPRLRPPFQPVTPPCAPMMRLSVDLLGPFVTTRNRNKYIVVWVDNFSRMTFASPIRNIEAETIVGDYMKNIFPKYGASMEVVSDRGGQFTGKLMETLWKLMGTKGIHTSSYNPQSNGVTERANSKVLRVLSKLCESHFSRWDEYLPYVVQNLNNVVHRSTGESPFFVFHGFDQMHPSVEVTATKESVEVGVHEMLVEFVERVNNAREEVFVSLTRSSDINCRNASKGAKLQEFEPGDTVLCLDPTSYTGKNRKFKERYKGPYRIVFRTGVVNYKIRGVRDPSDEKNVHVNKLKKYFLRNQLNNDKLVSDVTSGIGRHHNGDARDRLSPLGAHKYNTRSKGGNGSKG